MVEAERFDLTLKDAQSIAERNGNFRFIIHAEQGTITLPISVLDQLPADEDDSKGRTGIRISISIRESDSETADSIRKAIRQSGGKLLSNPIRVEAVWTDADGRQNALDLAGNRGTIQLSFHEPVSAKNAAVTRFDPITGHMRFVPALVSPDKAVFAIAEGGIRDYAIATAGAVFADISGHWAQDAAEALAAAMIVSGRSEGAFEPSGTVTRAEFAAMLARGLGLPKENTAVKNDTNGQKPWYTDYVGALQQAGIIQGYEDGSMRLDADVTRQEMAVMLARALVYTGNEPDAQGDISRFQYRFADGGNIEPWALNGVLHVIQTGIMQGDEENRLRPDAAASRAESAVVLLRLLEAASYLSRLQ